MRQAQTQRQPGEVPRQILCGPTAVIVFRESVFLEQSGSHKSANYFSNLAPGQVAM